MTKAFDSIMAGLGDALAHAQGDTSRGKTHVVEVPTVDVAAIRKATGLSQQKFADRFGLDASAIRDWEQKRRVPNRTTRAYLTVIAKAPDLVREALGDASK